MPCGRPTFRPNLRRSALVDGCGSSATWSDYDPARRRSPSFIAPRPVGTAGSPRRTPARAGQPLALVSRTAPVDVERRAHRHRLAVDDERPVRRNVALVRHTDRARVDDAQVADAPVELMVRVPDHDRAGVAGERLPDRVVGRSRGRDRSVVGRSRVTVENAVDGHRERQGLEPLEIPGRELAAFPVLG